MLQASIRPSGDGAEQVQIGEQRLGRRNLGTEPRRRGLVGEPEDEQRVGQHERACGLRPSEVVLIQATNLAGRESMRGDRLGETQAVVTLGARQRHQVLHRRMRDDVAVTDVLLNRVRECPHQTEAPRHPAHAPIEAPRDHVERQPVLLVQGAQQPRLLKHVLGGVGLEQLAEDQGLRGRHLPDDGGDRVPVESVQTADAFMAVHDEVLRRATHHDDRHLLPDLGERGQQPALAGGLPHTERVVAPIQLVKFQLHRYPVSGASGLDIADESPPAPHATAHRRCSAARTSDDARPGP